MWLENVEGKSIQWDLPTCEEHCSRPTHILTLNGVVVCLCDDCFKELFGTDDNNPKTKDVDLSPCKDGNYYVRGVGNDCISKVKIDGHEYLLYNYYKGCGICHSASCPCHTSFRFPASTLR